MKELSVKLAHLHIRIFILQPLNSSKSSSAETTVAYDLQKHKRQAVPVHRILADQPF